MKIEDLSLAVFSECPECRGSGKRQILLREEVDPIKARCYRCGGYGKSPIFIPLAELFAQRRELNESTPFKTPDIVDAVGRWLEKQEDAG